MGTGVGDRYRRWRSAGRATPTVVRLSNVCTQLQRLRRRGSRAPIERRSVTRTSVMVCGRSGRTANRGESEGPGGHDLMHKCGLSTRGGGCSTTVTSTSRAWIESARPRNSRSQEGTSACLSRVHDHEPRSVRSRPKLGEHPNRPSSRSGSTGPFHARTPTSAGWDRRPALRHRCSVKQPRPARCCKEHDPFRRPLPRAEIPVGR